MNSSNALKVNFLLGIAFLVMLLAMGCTEDPIVDSQSDTLERLDVRLHELLTEQSNGLGANFYILPNSDDFDAIPQDANNPITSEKVALGQLLFHETGIALNPKKTVGMGKYSCASCHHAQGGFQACMPQGIGEGGSGFGFTGEGRIMASEYTAEEVDVQPLRSPSALNIAYQTNVLWNGMFGATNKNEGTQASWTADTPKATNFLGYEGVETQAIAGLKVHRLKADSGLVKENVNYQALFDAAFANNPVEERITQENAGLAIAAYERTLVANEAPFQQWLKGDNQAMTDAEKTGAILFFGKGKCSNCHNGPALNDMEFYALGMKDLYEDASALNVPIEDAAHLGRGGFTGKTSDNYK
ncbi:MAG: cytochrome-c peroxidase, partial [Chitinophagales bacterium]